MNELVTELGFGSLGGIFPEIILLVGGILIMLLDMAQGREQDSGKGFMGIAVLTLIMATVGVTLQLGMQPVTVMGMVEIDPFSAFLKILLYAGMALVAIGGGSFMNKHATGRGEFWTLFLFVTLSMSIAVSANNLLLIFLSIEFLSITSYILAGILRENRRSAEAGIKYFIYGSVASSMMLYGMSLIYGAGGSIYLEEISKALAAAPHMGEVVLPAALLTLVGLGFKASLAPFHQWAPDTYDGAPTPVTAYLATASKAVGFAVMARVLVVALGAYDVDWVPVLAGLSVLTMTVGNLMALRQSSVKRMLAYSSVAQAGYVLMGLTSVVASTAGDLTALSINGLNGLLIYLFAYLFTNIGAFMVVLAIEDTTGSTDISAFNNLGQRAPGLAWAMFLFLLSLTGIPLTGGFVGKFYVFGAAIQHEYWWLVGIALVNTGVAAFYYLNVVRVMFFSGIEDAVPVRFSIPVGVQFVVLICVGATIWLGLYPPSIIDMANNASRQLLTFIP